jgi:hypothetical protein
MTDCVTENRRKWLRTRTLYGGTITTVGGTPIIACTIRSISPFGAQVRLLSEHILPDKFILVDEKNGAGHHAKVVWRGSKLAGLWFEDSFPVDSTLPTHLEVLRTILDKAKLRQVDGLMDGGLTLEDALAFVNASYAEYRQWERVYGTEGSDVTQLQTRIRQLETENRRLKRCLSTATKARSESSQ